MEFYVVARTETAMNFYRYMWKMNLTTNWCILTIPHTILKTTKIVLKIKKKWGLNELTNLGYNGDLFVALHQVRKKLQFIGGKWTSILTQQESFYIWMIREQFLPFYWMVPIATARVHGCWRNFRVRRVTFFKEKLQTAWVDCPQMAIRTYTVKFDLSCLNKEHSDA